MYIMDINRYNTAIHYIQPIYRHLIICASITFKTYQSASEQNYWSNVFAAQSIVRTPYFLRNKSAFVIGVNSRFRQYKSPRLVENISCRRVEIQNCSRLLFSAGCIRGNSSICLHIILLGSRRTFSANDQINLRTLNHVEKSLYMYIFSYNTYIYYLRATIYFCVKWLTYSYLWLIGNIVRKVLTCLVWSNCSLQNGILDSTVYRFSRELKIKFLIF